MAKIFFCPKSIAKSLVINSCPVLNKSFISLLIIISCPIQLSIHNSAFSIASPKIKNSLLFLSPPKNIIEVSPKANPILISILVPKISLSSNFFKISIAEISAYLE